MPINARGPYDVRFTPLYARKLYFSHFDGRIFKNEIKGKRETMARAPHGIVIYFVNVKSPLSSQNYSDIQM